MPPLLLLLLLFCFLSAESISRYCLTHPPSPLLLTLSSSSRPAHFSVPFLPLSSFFIFFYFFHLLLNKTLPAPHPKKETLFSFSLPSSRGEEKITFLIVTTNVGKTNLWCLFCVTVSGFVTAVDYNHQQGESKQIAQV